MRQLSKHDVNKLSVAKLKELLPFQITADGEVIASVIPAHDVNTTSYAHSCAGGPCDCPQPNPFVNKLDKPLTELPLSKKRQAAGLLSS